MEWFQVAGIILGSGVLVALINLVGSTISEKRQRKYTVVDNAEVKKDKLDALDSKVEKYKVDTDKEILDIKRDMGDMETRFRGAMNEMETRFQDIFTNLDLKLDDSLRHVSKGNALLLAQSINSIAYRAGKIIKNKSVEEDEYRNLNTEFCRVCDLIGVQDDPDVLYLNGLIKKVEGFRM